MNTKTVTGILTGLTLLATTAFAGQNGKGIINTLDLDKNRISIDYADLTIESNVRVLTIGGKTRTTDNLAERQHVSFKMNKWGRVTEIRIYDPNRLKEQGFHRRSETED